MSLAEFLVIIPAFDEQDSLPRVLANLSAARMDCDVLVVDDGSTDGTAAIAREAGVQVISHGANRGYGAALVTGYRHALARGYRMLVQLDADGQHDAAQIALLLAPLRRDEADVVIGSRMLAGGGHATSVPRWLGIQVFAALGRLLTGRGMTDPTSGFIAMNARAAAFLVDNTPPDYPDLNVLLALHRAGLRMLEVPVVMDERHAGRSQMRGMALVLYVPRMLSYIWHVWNKTRPRGPG